MNKQFEIEPLLNSKPLKENKYADLKGYDLELSIDLKALKYMNENYLVKAIKSKLAIVGSPKIPFTNLGDASMAFKINYAFHYGIPKAEVIEKLGITNKKYIDVTWLYHNNNYKQRIVDFVDSDSKAA